MDHPAVVTNVNQLNGVATVALTDSDISPIPFYKITQTRDELIEGQCVTIQPLDSEWAVLTREITNV